MADPHFPPLFPLYITGLYITGLYITGLYISPDVYSAMLFPICQTPSPPSKSPAVFCSAMLFTQLMKDAALCRNRGGEALAGIWGQLMVYGTVPGVNPCGNVNLQNYFDQQ